MKPRFDWANLLKVLFGFATLFILAYLVKAIGLGNVEEKSSFGLKDVIQPIGTVFILWGAWAYPMTKDKDDSEK